MSCISRRVLVAGRLDANANARPNANRRCKRNGPAAALSPAVLDVVRFRLSGVRRSARYLLADDDPAHHRAVVMTAAFQTKRRRVWRGPHGNPRTMRRIKCGTNICACRNVNDITVHRGAERYEALGVELLRLDGKCGAGKRLRSSPSISASIGSSGKWTMSSRSRTAVMFNPGGGLMDRRSGRASLLPRSPQLR